MSEEQKQDPNQNPPKNDQASSPEEERKKQFERMKEKFGRQNSQFGGSKNTNGGNNFYWIYGVVVAILLFVVFYGNDFGSKLVEVSQSKFYQEMLVKGDVTDVV